MNKITTTLVCLLVSGTLQAGGYRVATQGQKALAMGHTGVALSESSEVLFFNPGGMTQLQADADFTGGLTLLAAESEYLNQETLVHEETDSPLGTPINAYYVRKYSEQLSWGLGVYTPYGNKVKWPTDWVGSHLVNEIELQAIYFQPTIGYQINGRTSIGFGPNLVVGAVEFNRNLSTSLTNADGDRSNVTIKADNVTAWGYNIGLLHQLDDKTSLGVSYRSEVTLEARGGDADFDDIPTALESTFADGDFDADLPLPAELTVGVAYQYSDRLTLAFDYNYTFWDAYDELVIEFDNGITSVNARNYEDSSIYRFGLQYRYNDKWTLRGGIYFDESPVQDGYFAPETPRNDSIGYTAGATYRYSKNLEFDVSLLILTFDDEENSYDYYEEGGFTIPFGGTYDSAANSIGFGLSYKY
jgi:long-chain fatty acid transport protein